MTDTENVRKVKDSTRNETRTVFHYSIEEVSTITQSGDKWNRFDFLRSKTIINFLKPFKMAKQIKCNEITASKSWFVPNIPKTKKNNTEKTGEKILISCSMQIKIFMKIFYYSSSKSNWKTMKLTHIECFNIKCMLMLSIFCHRLNNSMMQCQ